MKNIVKVLLHVVVVLLLCCNVIITVLYYLITLPVDTYKKVNQSFRYGLTKLPHSIRQFLPYYDETGLRYSLQHLKSINLLQMLEWPLEKQAKYADYMIVNFCKTSSESIDSKLFPENSIIKTQINVTSLGNCAYVILNHPLMSEREKALENFNDMEKEIKS